MSMGAKEDPYTTPLLKAEKESVVNTLEGELSAPTVPQWVWYALGFTLALTPILCFVGICVWCSKYSKKQVGDVLNRGKSRQYAVDAETGGTLVGVLVPEDGSDPKEGGSAPLEGGPALQAGIVTALEEEIVTQRLGCDFTDRDSDLDDEEDSWDDCYINNFDSIADSKATKTIFSNKSSPPKRAKSVTATVEADLPTNRYIVRALSEPYYTASPSGGMNVFSASGTLHVVPNPSRHSFCSINAPDLSSDEEQKGVKV